LKVSELVAFEFLVVISKLYWNDLSLTALVCFVQMQRIVYPLDVLPPCNSLQESAKALYLGVGGTFQQSRPTSAAATAGSIGGALLWEANPAHLLLVEHGLYLRLLECGVTWNRRHSEAAHARAYCSAEEGATIGDSISLRTQARDADTLRANCLARAVQRQMRGMPLAVVRRHCPLSAQQHGSAAAYVSFTGNVNNSPRCEATGLWVGQMRSSPAHLLDHTDASLAIGRWMVPQQYEGLAECDQLDQFGTLLPAHVSAAIDETPAMAEGIKAAALLGSQCEANDSVAGRMMELEQQELLLNCRRDYLAALCVGCGHRLSL